jgi:hypothetical protein
MAKLSTYATDDAVDAEYVGGLDAAENVKRFPYRPAINTQTGSYTLVLADGMKIVEMNVGSANNLTVPLNSSVAFPIGTLIDITQIGAGQTTVVATGGVTISSKDGNLKLTGQWSGATLYKRATDTWVLMGDITA